MAPRLGLLALLPLFAAASFVGVYLFYYQRGYDPPLSVDIQYQELTSPGVSPGAFEDRLTTHVERGVVLIDALHSNAFREREIVTLSSRIANRGYSVDVVGDFGAADDQTRLSLLEEKLRRADSFMVSLPREAYTDAEAALVERFVRKGGKLLLISDPNRPQQINTLAERFGLEFQPDYLYNLVEHDLNFRHIFVREFQPDELTAGLDAITLYTSGSIRSTGAGLAFADSNTVSSVVESSDGLTPFALGNSRRVLAIADFTFMVPPHNSLLDNDRLVSNIADYITDSERVYELSDFPHFFESGPEAGVDILLGRSKPMGYGHAGQEGPLGRGADLEGPFGGGR